MRHGKKISHLSRTNTHRKAMLSNMASSLIEHKRINTTVAKAKALKKFIEPIKIFVTVPIKLWFASAAASLTVLNIGFSKCF